MRTLVVFLSIGVLAVAAGPASAQTFGYHETITLVGAIADTQVLKAAQERLPGRPAVGFKHSELLIGVPVWTWAGEYCVYARDRHIVITRAQAAELLGVAEAQMQAPFFYRFPFGLVVVPVILGVGGPVSYALHRRRERARRRVEALSASLIGAELPPVKPSRSFLSE